MKLDAKETCRKIAYTGVAAALVLAGIAATGCSGNANGPSNENTTSQQSSDNASNNTENASDDSKKATSDLRLLIEPWNHNAPTTVFSNGRAWVTTGIPISPGDTLMNPGDHYVIDEEGNAIYTVPDQEELTFFRCGEFNDAGYSYYMAQGKDKVQNTTDDISAYPVTSVIIDKEGNETYRLESPDGDSEYAIMGSDGENFLVFEKTVGFDSNDAYFYMIDKDGKQVSEKAKLPDASRTGGSTAQYIIDPVKQRGDLGEPYATYLGEGVFSLQKMHHPNESFPVIYNSKTAQVFELTGGQLASTGFEDGSVMFRKDTDDYLLDLPLSALESEETYKTWQNKDRDDGIALRVEKTKDGKVSTEILSDVFASNRGVKMGLRGDQTMWRNPDLTNSSKWYDDIPPLPTQYENKDVSIDAVSPTFDGITAIELEGADGDYYYVLEDEDGNELYERIELPMANEHRAELYIIRTERNRELEYMDGEHDSNSNLLFMASDGTTFYVHDDKIMKISPKGETSEVAKLADEHETLLAIDGHYLYFDNRIYDFENDKWLESVKVSSSTKEAQLEFGKKESKDDESKSSDDSDKSENSNNSGDSLKKTSNKNENNEKTA